MIAVQAGDRRAYRNLLRDCELFIRRAGRRAGVSDDRLHDVVQAAPPAAKSMPQSLTKITLIRMPVQSKG